MRKGDEKEAPYGKVVVISVGRFGVLCKYLDGPLEGKQARIERKYLN